MWLTGRLAALLAPAWLLAGCISRAGPGRPESDLPLEAAAYRPLARLASEGYIEAGSLGTLPLCRSEAARIVSQADAAAELPEVEQLQQLLASELQDLAFGAGVSYLRPLDDARFEYLFMDGAAEPHNQSGREYRAGGNLRLALSSRFVWGALSGYVNWEARWLDAGAADAGLAAHVHEGALKLSLGPWFIEYGRQSLWWGPGRHGALLLSNNAPPLDMVRIGNAEPVLLPGWLARLGPVHGEVFWTRLEADRVVPRPYFAGMRATVKPTPHIELGASRTAMFGGIGRPPVDAGTIWEILTAQHENEPGGSGNQLAALDWTLRVPALPLEFYGELGGEDEAGNFFSKDAILVGLFLPSIGGQRELDFRIEYADTYFDGHDGQARVWYTHGIYQSGYTYGGRIIGHHVGTDGRGLYLELGLYPAARTRLAVSLDLQRRELYAAAPEERSEFAVAVEHTGKTGWRLRAGYARQQFLNYQQHAGDDRSGNLFVLELGRTF